MSKRISGNNRFDKKKKRRWSVNKETSKKSSTYKLSSYQRPIPTTLLRKFK